jgi:hypothetical protein
VSGLFDSTPDLGSAPWPLNKLGRRWLRITLGNTILATVASFSTAGLLVAMLFDGVFRSRMSAAWERAMTLFVSVVVGAGLSAG